MVEALQRSQLGRGLFAASGTYLSGIATYLLKLGPDNRRETTRSAISKASVSCPIPWPMIASHSRRQRLR